MDSSIFAIGLILIICAITLFGGYARTRNPNPQSKVLRSLASLAILIVIGIGAFLQFSGFDDEVEPIATIVSPTQGIPRIDGLELDETTNYQMVQAEDIALTYEGEMGQVITFRVEPETGTPPTVRVSSQISDDPPVFDRSFQARGNMTIICGYEFIVNGTYIFTFEAVETTTYTVNLESGNTC